MKSTQEKQIIKVVDNERSTQDDILAVEEPLQINISVHESDPVISRKNVAITMRTPIDDKFLALGFLFTEGIIKTKSQIRLTQKKENSINIVLNNIEKGSLKTLERNFYISSSCGICGKASIESVKTHLNAVQNESNLKVPHQLLCELPNRLRQNQSLFKLTGGIHGAAIFDNEGKLILSAEDVGRHNALDKLIGKALDKEMLPLKDFVLLLSGRASFELIQKAAIAGIKIIAAVGAPSSLAVDLANEHNITLVGFLSEKRSNIYSGEDRILFS